MSMWSDSGGRGGGVANRKGDLEKGLEKVETLKHNFFLFPNFAEY